MAENKITVASPPTTNDVVQETLAMMAALTGVITDYNRGSQIRTIMESVGAVVEQQSIGAQTLVLQAIATSAMTLFNIQPNPAIAAVGQVTFATGTGANPPPATQSVAIPAGTLVQTAGGVQFATTQQATLQPGATSVTVPVQAVTGGAGGNVAAGAIVQVISGLSYPLTITNANPTAGGIDAQSPSQGLSRLAAAIASISAGSPVAIANGVIGVKASGSAETVQYATVYEPWIAAGAGSGSTEAGFTVYIDNGAGAASAGLISAVKTKLDGNKQTGDMGLRDAGVPYGISAVQPIFANVAVSGSLNSLANTAVVSGAIAQAVQAYFTSLQFGISAEQAQLSALVSNAAIGALTSLDVTLAYASNPSTAVTAVTGLEFNRIVLQSLQISI